MMLFGEMCLLTVAVFMMIGLTKGVTERLFLNEYVAIFLIFAIVLLNVRGGVPLGGRTALYLGGTLQIAVAFYVLIRRCSGVKETVIPIFSALATAAITFAYYHYFTLVFHANATVLLLICSFLNGIWCAFSCKQSFAACVFASNTGSAAGKILHCVLDKTALPLFGKEMYALMTVSMVIGLLLQYFFTLIMQKVHHPRANSYYEAGAMIENN